MHFFLQDEIELIIGCVKISVGGVLALKRAALACPGVMGFCYHSEMMQTSVICTFV